MVQPHCTVERLISASFAAHCGTIYAIEHLNVEPRPPRYSHTWMVQGLFNGGVYFVQLNPDNRCVNNLRVVRIQEILYVQ